MSTIDLKHTKHKLAIAFTFIVFFIVIVLWFSYFSFRYYNFYLYDKDEFNKFTNQFQNNLIINSDFLDLILDEWFRTRNNKNYIEKPKPQLERMFRFISFVILDKDWNIIAQNLDKDLNFEEHFLDINYNISVIDDWIFIKKIDISTLDDYKTIIFFKKQIYSFSNYLSDLLFFLITNIIFFIIFYYIWLYFVKKNLQPVSDTLNDMNDFIHNANHELKTPISVISSNLQLIKATKNYDEDLIKSSINEIKRIDNLIYSLWELSDINKLSWLVLIDLDKEIKEIIEESSLEIEKNELTINYSLIKNTKIKANKNYFYIIFSNLLRNAIKYNKTSWKIDIKLEKNKLTISNTWDWIKKQDLKHIFDRFFKWEKSRNTEGFWIGLSLVKKICDIYDWKIMVKSEENKETSFEIRF